MIEIVEQKMITNKFYDRLCEPAKSIREQVFVREQGFQNEFDAFDDTAIHLVLFQNGSAVATGRLIEKTEKDGTFIIGRVAVLPQYRELHLGSDILRLLEGKAQSLNAKKIELSAQCRVQKFYEKNGYHASGDIYLDESCEHIHMEKSL
jgi:predicted GNAT family N-acyltransferase